jgi:hypothetical protein
MCEICETCRNEAAHEHIKAMKQSCPCDRSWRPIGLLADGCEVVSPICRPPFTCRNIPDTNFC